MRDYSRAPLGQGSALAMGLLFLYLGASSFFETVETHAWIFRCRRGSIVEGELAAILMATTLLAGAYLVTTSCRRMRAGHSGDDAS